MLIKKTIDGALRLIGVLAAGEEASPEEHADALDRLIGLIDSFNTNNLLVSYISQKTYAPPVLGWKSNITIGLNPTLDYNEIAPIEVLTAFFRDSSGIDSPLALMSIDQWSSQTNKAIVASPSSYFVQYGPDKHTEIQFDTIPSGNDVLHLMCRVPFVAASGIYLPTDNIEWDYGFERMLRYHLAIELAPEYGVSVRPEVAVVALTAMSDIKQSNYSPSALEVDIALRSSGGSSVNLIAGITSGWNW